MAPKFRNPWTRPFVAGAIVATAALSSKPAVPVHAEELKRSLERLRIAVPAETRLDFSAPRLRSGQAGQGPDATRRFDIPSAPLSIVVAEFERITGLTCVLASPSIADITSAGLNGTYTIPDALARLLEGTSVTYRFTDAGTVSFEIRIAQEAVSVTADTLPPAPASPKYAQPLIDVPQTIEVIPREVMEAQGVTTLSEALRNVPGISLQAGEGGGASNTSGDMFNMRGFSASNSLFVDGVRDDGLMSRDVFNLEQVEVFMGPTGSDVGRGNAAGYVNMATKVPHLESSYAVAYSYGSADHNRSTVDLNHPLTLGEESSWIRNSAVRLNALWQDGGTPGRDIVTHKNQSIAPSMSLGLGTLTRVTASAQITRQENVPDYGIPGSAWAEEPLTPTTVVASAPVDSTNYFGSVAYDFDKVEQESYTGRIEHDVRGFTLRNQTRYNRTHREAVITSIQNPAAFVPETETVALSRQGNERENEILSNQSSIQRQIGTGRLRHSVIAGVELAAEQQFAPAIVGVGTRNPASIYAPNPFDPVIGYAVRRGRASNLGEVGTVGVYAFDTVELSSRWQLSGGLRYERYNATYRVVDAAGVTTTDLSTADGLVSGKAGLLYRLTPQANLYLSYGSSVTPPGTANFTLSAQPNNQNNPNVEPQESKNYEVGAKLTFFESRLSVSTALFRTDNENVIYTVDATAIPPVYNQDDAQRVNGITVSALGQISSRWQLIGNFGYLDTHQISQNPLTNGKPLTLTPPFSGSLWTTYQFPARLTLGGGLRYMDDVFVNAANTIRSPQYALADAMAEYAVNTHLTLRLNVSNLTNEVYIRNVNNNGGRYNPGPPRTALLTSSVRF